MPLNQDRLDPNKIRVGFILNPIIVDREEKYFDFGVTLKQIVHDLGPTLPVNLSASINSREVAEEYWSLVKPKPGSSVTVVAIPAGGKRALNIIGGVASIAIGGLGLLTGGIGLGLGVLAPIAKLAFGGIASIGFGLTVKGLTMPPRQFTPTVASSPGFISASAPVPETISAGVISQQTATRDPLRPSISGSQNQKAPFGRIPRGYGRYRMFGVYAANEYTELVGDDQYVRILLCLGYGPLEVSDIKMGDDLIVAEPVYNSVQDVVGSAFQGIQYELKQGYPDDTPMTLFPNSVSELTVGLPFSFSGGYVTRTAPPNADQLSAEIIFTNGLTQFLSDGSRTNRTVEVSVEYRLTGSADPWVSAGTISVTENSTQPVQRGLTWNVDLGDYDIQLKRLTADSSDSTVFDQVAWSKIRSTRNVSPFGPIKDQEGNVKGIALLAMRIKATEQLQGTPSSINCIIQSILPVYDGNDWLEEPTSNPAWILADVICGSWTRTKIPYSKLDTESLMSWAENCENDGRECNFIIDSANNRRALADQVGSIGQARFTERNGLYGVIEDLEQAVPMKLFTARNVRGLKMKWNRVVQPHVMRVQFINPDSNWQQDEAFVYDDGYDASNARIEEPIQFPGVTNYDQAWKAGRHYLAVARLRPYLYEFFTDIENIQITPGDLIRVGHDKFDWGTASGRITDVTLDIDGNAVSITLDGKVTMNEGNNYAIRIGQADQNQIISDVIQNIGEQTSVIFDPPIPADDPLPVVGDMYTFGLVDHDSIPMLVKDIAYGTDFSAQITGVDYSPLVYQATTGTIPPFESHVVIDLDTNRKIVPVPVVLNIRSGEEVLYRGSDGTLQSRIAITLAHGDLSIGHWQAMYRRSDQTDFTQLPQVSLPTNEISIMPVEDGVEYDIRIRAISRSHISSPWIEINNHFVVGKSTPPSDVPSITLTGTDAIWSYPDLIKPPDFRGFYLSYNFGENENYASSVRAHDAFLTVNKFDISTLPGGPKTLMVVAVDTSGNVSSNPAFIFVDQGDAIVANLVETYDFGAASYPGTVTGGALDGGDLKADSLSTFWTPSDLQLFYPTDDGELFWDVDLHDSLVYASSPWFPLAEQLPARMSLLFSVTAMASLEYRAVRKVTFWGEDGAPFYDGDSDPFWDPETIPLTEWLPWPGYLDIPADSQDGYQVRIVTHAGLEQGVISRLIVQLDVEDLLEFLHDVDITAGGTRLPITKPFRVIKNIQASKVQSLGGSDFRNYETIDKDAVLGPLVELFDASHVSTSGRIDATIQGY